MFPHFQKNEQKKAQIWFQGLNWYLLDICRYSLSATKGRRHWVQRKVHKKLSWRQQKFRNALVNVTGKEIELVREVERYWLGTVVFTSMWNGRSWGTKRNVKSTKWPTGRIRQQSKAKEIKNSKSKNTGEVQRKGNKDNLAKTGNETGFKHKWNKWLAVTGSIQEPLNWDGISWAEGEASKHEEGPHKPGSQIMMPPRSGKSQAEEEVPGPLSGEAIPAWP